MASRGSQHDGMPAAGDVVGGRFRIDDVLGAGGMGIVAAATHVELGTRVAIKFMRSELLQLPAVAERFVREARAVVQLTTEHVCKVFDIARLETGAPYIVMELLQGVDLSRTVVRKALPMTMAVEYVMQACIALAEAHAAGLVHRDLKPANLFVTRRLDGRPLVKVLDFGVAKAFNVTSKLTRTSALLGSPAYMSPEQFESARDVDARADIWALGVTLYQLLSARLPFFGGNQAELAVKILTEPPAALDVDPRLRTIVDHCLEKSPDRRYPDVRAFVSDLVPFGGPAARGIAAAVAGLADTRIGLSPPTPPAVLSVGTPYPPTPRYAPAPTAATGVPVAAVPAVATSAAMPIVGSAPGTAQVRSASRPPRARRSRVWWIVAGIAVVVVGNIVAVLALTSRPRGAGDGVARGSAGERIAAGAPGDAVAAPPGGSAASPRAPDPARPDTSDGPPVGSASAAPARAASMSASSGSPSTPPRTVKSPSRTPAGRTKRSPGAPAPAAVASAPGPAAVAPAPAPGPITAGSAPPQPPIAAPQPAPPAAAPPPSPPPAAAVVAESLSTAQLMTGLQQLEPRFRACARSYRVHGKVMVTVTVAPDGRVANVSTGQSSAFDQCVLSQARNVSFPATRVGGQAIVPLDLPWI